MAYADHCNTTPSYNDAAHTNSCNDFSNYADAWLDCAGHADSSPELCPGAFQGNFYVDNSACYNDVSHVNSYSHTPHYNVYSHTPHTNVPHTNNYYHTPHTNNAHYNSYSHTAFADYHLNTSYGHTPFANGSHSHSCNVFQNVVGYSHGDYTDPSGYWCNWNDSSPWPGGLKHGDSSTFGNTSFYNSPAYNDYSHQPFYNVYYHTPYNHTAFYNYYSHTPYNHTPHYNVYSHTPHYNVYSHTPFVDFCNHTDHNAG